MTFEEVTNQMLDLYKKKNSDYGNVFEKSCDEFGLISPAIRLNDKINRLKTLIDNPAVVNNEGIEDTLIDIANYAVMTLVWLKNHDLPS